MRCIGTLGDRQRSPLADTATMALFARSTPGSTLTTDAVGFGCPQGQAVTYPAPRAPVAVTLTATPLAPAGTPRSPVRWTAHVTPAPTRAPLRVSRARTGST